MPLRHLLLISFFIFMHHSSSITDTITPTRPLKDGQILTSNNNKFALGFFSPGNTTTNRYLGIWYNKVSLQTVVWVANRDRPINASDGMLSVTSNGNLILSSRNVTLWSTQITYNNGTTEFAPKAQLLASGNFVLLFQNETQKAAWQSFDYPTHVFLPGMKLGLNRKTGFSYSLNSWRSVDDPGHGNYTFKVDHESGSPEFFLYKDGSDPVWRTGPWVGDRWSGVPEMSRSFIFNYTFVDTRNEVYATYKILNDSIVSIFLLDGESGTIQRKTWHESSRQWIKFWAIPLEDCDQYANCGAYGLCTPRTDQFQCSCFTGYEPKSPRDWYLREGLQGCSRASNVSMCRNGEGFIKLANVKVPDTSRAKMNLSMMSLEECKTECLKNCSCLAYTSATDSVSTGGPVGCISFYGDLMDTRAYVNGGGQDLYFRVDAAELAKSLDNSKAQLLDKKHLAILVIACLALTSTVLVSIAYWCNKRRRDFKEQQERFLWLGDDQESNSHSDFPVFQLSTIVSATQNFSHMNLLGEGGFGPVYKGQLSDGHEIAVKRLSKNSGQGINEFKNEVRLISKLQHRNLVKTLGCCVGGEEKMLVYEFLPNKSLDRYIFNEEKKMQLDWEKRYNIIVGIARGVLYLHQDSTLKIIHRDLKASNILLDDKMTPKISDFGMARIFGNDQSEANTNRVVGTYGYMSPEYAMEGLFSTKSDVFSFGIILLEIISGQKSSGYYNDHLSTNLTGYVWKLWQDGNAIEIVDKAIVSRGFEDEILRCIQIGLLCVQENPIERPAMPEVIIMLNNDSNLPPPKEPAFIIKRNHDQNGDPISSSTEARSVSVNDLTITIVDAR